MSLQIPAYEGRSLSCFEEIVLEDQQVVMGYHALKNEISGKTRPSRGSCWPVPKSAALKGLLSLSTFSVYLRI